MTVFESADLVALERAIRSLEPERAPDGLRSALRRDLVIAADARPAVAPMARLFAAVPRLAFAAAAAVLLITSGWAVAASAPGDLLYPLKETIVRSFSPSQTDEIRVPSTDDLVGSPPDAEPADPSSRPLGSAAPVIPAVLGDRPAATSAPARAEPSEAPAQATNPAATGAPAPAESSDAPARATPAIPPDPAGPRATPAVPPPHR
jgi:hypothetical protein